MADNQLEENLEDQSAQVVNFEEAYRSLNQQYGELKNLYDQQQNILNQLQLNQVGSGQSITIRLVDGPVDDQGVAVQQLELVDDTQVAASTLASVVNATIGIEQDQVIAVQDTVGVQTRRSHKRKAAQQPYEHEQSAAIDSISEIEMVYPSAEEDSTAQSAADDATVSPRRRKKYQDADQEGSDTNQSTPRKVAPKRSGRKLVLRPEDQIKEDVSVWCCSFCDAIITTKWYLRQHLKNVHNKEEQVDSIKKCRFDSEEPQRRFQQLKAFHDLDRWPCPHCPQMYKSRNGLEQHLRLIHKDSPKDLKLEPISSDSEEYRQKLELQKRNIFTPHVLFPPFLRETIVVNRDGQKTEQIRYGCTDCVMSSISLNHIRRHYETLHRNIRYLCPSCVLMFRSAYDLRYHMEKRHPNVLVRREDIQSTEDPNDPEVKRRKKILDDPKNAHLRENFQCTAPGCSYKARLEKSVRSHYESVHLRIRYCCPECPTSFNRQLDFRHHVENEHPDYKLTAEQLRGIQEESKEWQQWQNRFPQWTSPTSLLDLLPQEKRIFQVNWVEMKDPSNPGQMLYRCAATGCQFESKEVEAVRTHHDSEHQKLRWLCPLCEHSTPTIGGMRTHFAERHQDHPLRPDQLSRAAERSDAYNKHMRQFAVRRVIDHDRFSKDDEKEANICGFSTREDGWYVCLRQNCSYAHKHPRRVRLHYEEVHQNMIYFCPSCKSKFTRVYDRRRHVGATHGYHIADRVLCWPPNTSAYKTHLSKEKNLNYRQQIVLNLIESGQLIPISNETIDQNPNAAVPVSDPQLLEPPPLPGHDSETTEAPTETVIAPQEIHLTSEQLAFYNEAQSRNLPTHFCVDTETGSVTIIVNESDADLPETVSADGSESSETVSDVQYLPAPSTSTSTKVATRSSNKKEHAVLSTPSATKKSPRKR